MSKPIMQTVNCRFCNATFLGIMKGHRCAGMVEFFKRNKVALDFIYGDSFSPEANTLTHKEALKALARAENHAPTMNAIFSLLKEIEVI